MIWEGKTIDTHKMIDFHIGKEREGSYFTIPFEMPPDVERLSLKYAYERHHATRQGDFTSRTEINIIDLGLIAPDGTQVGASGSDKTFIEISETNATPGYHACPLVPGKWDILVGAYKVYDGWCKC